MTRTAAEQLQGECLLLAATTADAGLLENALRLSGHTVRVIAAPGPDTLKQMLGDQDYLAVIVDLAFPKLRLRELVRGIRKTRPETPVLTWDEQFDPTRLRNVLEDGADGMLSRSDTQLSINLLEREIAHGRMRLQLNSLRERLGEQARKDAEEWDALDAPVLIVQEGIIVSCNAAAAEQLVEGHSDRLLAMPVLDMLGGESVPALREAMRRIRRNKESSVELHLQWLVEGGMATPLSMTIAAIEHDGEPAVELRGNDESEEVDEPAARDRLRKWLANARVPKGMHPVLLLFGVDNLPGLEDQVGVFGRDELCRGIGRLLMSSPLTDAHLAPLEGGSIALACATKSLEEMQEWVSARLRQVSRQIFAVGDAEITATASAVIYPLPPPPRIADSVLVECGNSLKEIREQDEPGVIRLTGDAAAEMQRREHSAQWAGIVREALDENRFELAFQNIACLTNDAREHADVLLRLNSREGENIPAREFMPAAQDHGLMADIDRWVVRHALQRLQQVHAEGNKTVFLVRLDMATLQQHEAFLQWLAGEWQQAKLPEKSLVVVLRERMLQTQMRRGMALLGGLQKLGLATGIDHFGITSQSHELLRRLPVDYVKLHADFTAAIADASSDISAFQLIMEVAKQRGIQTVAERVTSANAMARLWQMGVNFLMGSHVHEPAAELSHKQFRMR